MQHPVEFNRKAHVQLFHGFIYFITPKTMQKRLLGFHLNKKLKYKNERQFAFEYPIADCQSHNSFTLVITTLSLVNWLKRNN